MTGKKVSNQKEEDSEDEEDEESSETKRSIRKKYSDLSPSFANLGRKFLENNKLGRLKHYKAVFYHE